MNISNRVPHALSHVSSKIAATLLALAFISTGCTLDFDDFNAIETPQVNSDVSPDTGSEQDTAHNHENDSSSGEDVPTNDAGLPIDLSLGESCQEDSQCKEGGFCMGSYCTYACDPDENTCDSGSSCQKVGNLQVCVLDCDAHQTCSDMASRDDLGCVDLLDFNPGGKTLQAQRACLPDADDDRVFDLHDNCPDVANANQLDSDGDGIGDACDPEIYCHQDATNGYLEYPLIDFAPTDFTVPDYIDGTWLPILGGKIDNGISPDLLILDRANTSWRQHTLPYAATQYGIAALRDGNFLLTPGEAFEGVSQIGPTVLLQSNGQLQNSFTFANNSQAPTLATTSLGVPVLHSYSPAPALSWLVRAYNTNTNTYTSFRSWTDPLVRRAWYASRDLQGAAIIYSGTDFISVSPMGTAASVPTFAYPSLADSSQIIPFILPAPGEQFYAFDRRNGQALRFSPFDSVTASALEKGFTLNTAMPELNLDLQGLTDVHFVAMPHARGLLIVARPADTPEKLVVREYNFACLATDQSTDSDEDGIPDIIDNCPFDANPDQLDTDGDNLGDACDPDIDGDGILNADDVITGPENELGEREIIDLSRDSDNDGTPNASDDDIDGDGIPNAQDRFPFDSNNDGIPNIYSADADGDGFSDVDERTNGTNPYNLLSFPGAGTILYIDENNGTRHIKTSPLAEFHTAAQTIETPEGVTPYWPQITSDQQSLIYLANAPGQTTAFALYTPPTSVYNEETEQIDEIDAVTTLYDTERTLRSLSIENGTLTPPTLLATHESPQNPNTWQISVLSIPADESTIEQRNEISFSAPLVRTIPQITDSILIGSQVYFLGGAGDCASCLNLYRVSRLPDSTPVLVTTPSLESTRLQQANSNILLIGRTAANTHDVLYAMPTSTLAPQKMFLPAGMTRINSLAAISGSPHSLLSGSGESGNNALWFLNGLTFQWHLISSSTNDIREISWIP